MEVLRGKVFMNRRGHSWQGNCRSKCPGAGLRVECVMSGLAGAPSGDERGAVLSFSALNSGPLARWSPRGLLPWAASPGGIFPLLWAGKKFSHLLIAMWPFKEKTIRDADLWALERREGRKKFSPEGRRISRSTLSLQKKKKLFKIKIYVWILKSAYLKIMY